MTETRTPIRERIAKLQQISVGKAIAVFAGLLLFLLVLFSLVIYFAPHYAFSVRVRDALHYPAVIVDRTQLISFTELDDNMVSVRRFYESQADDFSKLGFRVDFSTPEGEKRLMLREKELLNKMVEDRVIEMLAEQKGVKITPEMVSQNVDRKLKELGSRDDVRQKLSRLYGWSIEDFEQKVVRPSMYRDELEKTFKKEADVSSEAKKKIETAYQAVQQKKTFEETAKQYSDGATASEGGELGWIAMSSLSPEIAAALKDQKVGQSSGIIESSLGYHIVFLEERKQEQSGEMVRLKQIFAKKITFSDWLSSQMRQLNVMVLYKGYLWNKDASRIEFQDPEMKKFEENAEEIFQGDPSL